MSERTRGGGKGTRGNDTNLLRDGIELVLGHQLSGVPVTRSDQVELVLFADDIVSQGGLHATHCEKSC